MSSESPYTEMVPVVSALSHAADRYPTGRKVLVGPRRGVGRELLRRLSLERGGWIGFEASTPHDLAMELVGPQLAGRDLRVADEFDELAMIDASVDRSMRDRADVIRPFVEGVGLREAMANTIRALRLAGIDAAMLGRVGFRDRGKREALVRVLAQYERALSREEVTDTAGVMRLALAELKTGGVRLPDARFYLLPGQSRRGLTGQLLDWLVECGAEALADDAVYGLVRPGTAVDGTVMDRSPLSRLHATASPASQHDPDPETESVARPTVHANAAVSGHAAVRLDIFAAGSINDEIREVLRRVMEAGLRWDQVEIVATDPMTYGAALDTISRRLDIGASYSVGLPIGRTRPGRAVTAWLRWVRDGLSEDILRELIDRGDIAPPGGRTSGPMLARRLRRMLVGRGRVRYEAALDHAIQELARGPSVTYDDRSPAEIQAVHVHERQVLEDLAAILRGLLDSLPLLPGPAGGPDENRPVTPASLATGLLACLDLVPLGDPADRSADVDRTAHDRIRKRLVRLAATAHRPTSLDGAITVIAAKLETRVPAPAADGAAPWTSAGGRIHLADVDHGGWTGRPATFVVGLDAVRFPGATAHDTLLSDEDRRRLVPESSFPPLPTTADRLDERRWTLAALLARLRGQVTLSYSAWEATEARMVAPAPEMLQALRLMSGDPAADYDALHTATGRLACAVPRGSARLDDADVWFGLLARDGVLVTGVDVVRAVYTALDRGLVAKDARSADAFTPFHGRLAPRPALDPRGRPDMMVSAKRLETLGTCPHRYMLRYVLELVPPEESEFAPDRWLTPQLRGQLLHSVYQSALKAVGPVERNSDDPAFDDAARRALDAAIADTRRRHPPPGEAVFELERERLHEEVGLFVRMVRRHGAPWVDLELKFGAHQAGPTVEIDLPGGSVLASGAIDRVDQESDGRLVVIDYKTGSPLGYGREEAVFHGGRRLQHALYAAAARRVHDEAVARAEYHFPTHRGETQLVRYEERELRKARRIIDSLLEIVAHGHFYPTDNWEDCRFCDYRDVCRVRTVAGRTESPLADWSLSRRSSLPELWVLDALRGLRV